MRYRPGPPDLKWRLSPVSNQHDFVEFRRHPVCLPKGLYRLHTNLQFRRFFSAWQDHVSLTTLVDLGRPTLRRRHFELRIEMGPMASLQGKFRVDCNLCSLVVESTLESKGGHLLPDESAHLGPCFWKKSANNGRHSTKTKAAFWLMTRVKSTKKIYDLQDLSRRTNYFALVEW